MLSPILNDLSWKLITLIQKNGGLTAGRISLLFRDGSPCTLSNATIYRNLAEMRKAGVLIRHKRKLFINPIWVDRLHMFASTLAKEDGIEPAVNLPASEGHSIVYNAKSLFELDPIWNSILIEIIKTENKKEIYGYNSRAWYPLVMPDSEACLYESLAKRGATTHLTLGSAKEWVEFSKKLLPVKNLEIRQGKSTGIHGDIFVWASQNYIVRFDCPQAFKTRLIEAFDCDFSGSACDLEEMKKNFSRNVKCRLVVTKNKHLAKKALADLKQLI